MKTPDELAAERRCDIADAKLAVAEEMRGLIAILLAALVYVKFDTGFGAFVALFFPIFVIPYFYDKEHAAAHDALDRLTNTGNYDIPRPPDEPGD